ncbi:MAG TPA: penicillin-binding transpeptidase domain-containing protein [Solirubrobacteraceae bacterium]|jgi:penicillin-binding protein 2|nr:penicillin-binding transpeptidase domain-containing protein [Solirubrobacteraceae bacterium]
MSALERVHIPDRSRETRASGANPRFGQRTQTPATGQLGLRVAVLGGLALVMFGIIFFRLWYLQILTGEQYVQQAAKNTLREIPIAAPRGQIVDREGNVLVTSKVTNAVQLVPWELPPKGAHRRALYRRLGKQLEMSSRTIRELEEKGEKEIRYAPVTIKTNAGRGALTVLAERQNEFPGVKQEEVSVREYPHHDMAAQVFGYVRQITKEEEEPRNPQHANFKGVKPSTIVGQQGLEYQYDRYLRGTPGAQPIEVDSEGRAQPAKLAPTKPRPGYTLRLTLDLPLQQEGEVALRKGMELAHGLGNPGNGGAFVAMVPGTGEILAMGSYPSFNPNDFTKPLTEQELKALDEEGQGAKVGQPEPVPLLNRATEGAYPTGSTFKPITAIGSLEAGILNPEAGLGAGSCIYVSTTKFCNSGQNDYGAVGLVRALTVSSDTYFFEVGRMDNSHGPVIQHMAHELGIGRPTGIDLPGEREGTLPSPKWLEGQDALEAKCTREHHGKPCEIVAEPDEQWTVGHNMDLAVGQGDLQTDPLQMAVAYSTLANAFMNHGEGWVPTPHLGMAIESPSGGIVQTLNYPTRRRIKFNPANVDLVMEGIHDATFAQGGTSADVWLGWNQEKLPVYGKTGTAERPPYTEQAWYMCILPDAGRPIVIAVTVEQGGFGDQAAAPVARLIASKWFNQKLALVKGSSVDK